MEHCQTLEFLIYLVYNRIHRYRANLPSSAVRHFFFSAVLVLRGLLLKGAWQAREVEGRRWEGRKGTGKGEKGRIVESIISLK